MNSVKNKKQDLNEFCEKYIIIWTIYAKKHKILMNSVKICFSKWKYLINCVKKKLQGLYYNIIYVKNIKT